MLLPESWTLTGSEGAGIRANTGIGGVPPPRNALWEDRAVATDRRRSGARARWLILIFFFWHNGRTTNVVDCLTVLSAQRLMYLFCCLLFSSMRGPDEERTHHEETIF